MNTPEMKPRIRVTNGPATDAASVVAHTRVLARPSAHMQAVPVTVYTARPIAVWAPMGTWYTPLPTATSTTTETAATTVVRMISPVRKTHPPTERSRPQMLVRHQRPAKFPPAVQPPQDDQAEDHREAGSDPVKWQNPSVVINGYWHHGEALDRNKEHHRQDNTLGNKRGQAHETIEENHRHNGKTR